MGKLTKWMSKNQGLTVGLVVAASILFWLYGCESKVASLLDPNKNVKIEELNLEIQAETFRLESELNQLIKLSRVRISEIERQDAIKQKLMDFALLAAESGTLNPSGLAGLLFSVVGIGAVIDNRIKDKVIKNRPLAKS